MRLPHLAPLVQPEYIKTASVQAVFVYEQNEEQRQQNSDSSSLRTNSGRAQIWRWASMELVTPKCDVVGAGAEVDRSFEEIFELRT